MPATPDTSSLVLTDTRFASDRGRAQPGADARGGPLPGTLTRGLGTGAARRER